MCVCGMKFWWGVRAWGADHQLVLVFEDGRVRGDCVRLHVHARVDFTRQQTHAPHASGLLVCLLPCSLDPRQGGPLPNPRPRTMDLRGLALGLELRLWVELQVWL